MLFFFVVVFFVPAHVTILAVKPASSLFVLISHTSEKKSRGSGPTGWLCLCLKAKIPVHESAHLYFPRISIYNLVHLYSH